MSAGGVDVSRALFALITLLRKAESFLFSLNAAGQPRGGECSGADADALVDYQLSVIYLEDRCGLLVLGGRVFAREHEHLARRRGEKRGRARRGGASASRLIPDAPNESASARARARARR